MSLCRCHPAHRCGRCDDAREILAIDIAKRNERCGFVEASQVCLRVRNHAGAHQFEPTEKVIPF